MAMIEAGHHSDLKETQEQFTENMSEKSPEEVQEQPNNTHVKYSIGGGSDESKLQPTEKVALFCEQIHINVPIIETLICRITCRSNLVAPSENYHV